MKLMTLCKTCFVAMAVALLLVSAFAALLFSMSSGMHFLRNSFFLVFLAGFYEEPVAKVRSRTVGMTEFADSTIYGKFEVTEVHRNVFYRDGMVLLRSVISPHIIAKLREKLTPRSLNSMAEDAFLDFNVYSNLGSIAAQFFDSPGTETENESQTVQFAKDFISIRFPGALSTGWHVDFVECQGDLPANYTRHIWLRFAIPLLDNTSAPVILNQSKYVAGMSKHEAAKYWRGELPFRIETRFDSLGATPVPPLPGVHVEPSTAVHISDLHLGDAVLFNPCLWHRSPLSEAGRRTASLQPAFAHSSARLGTFSEPGSCRHGLHFGDPVAKSKSCFLTAFPPEARIRPGTQIDMPHVSAWGAAANMIRYLFWRKSARNQGEL